MGIPDAVIAVAGEVGSALGGWAVGLCGYNAVSAMAAASLALGLLLAVGVGVRSAIPPEMPKAMQEEVSL